MKNNTIILLTTVLLLMILIGCSSDNSNNNATSPLVNDPDISGESQRELLGIWRLKPDLGNQSTQVEFARDLAAHYDITQQIPAPTVSNESYDSITQIYQVDLTINNTGLAQDAFDVRLIVYTDNDGTELKNPDNWTALYDMPGGSFINPFKAYATTDPSRRFATTAFRTETLNIYLPGGMQYPNIILAIDASIPLNCEEPYLISNFTQENLGPSVGSDANITIDVFDWLTDVDSVKLHCPAITGNPTDDFTFDSGNTWNLNLVNNNGVGIGDYLAMISATSTGSGNLELYDILTIAVSSFLWAKTWGGLDHEEGRSVSLDQSGNAYVTGWFQNTVDFNPDGGGTQSSNGGFDVFLSKFDSSGNWQWSKTWGGTGGEEGYSVSLDQSGNAYVTGYFWGTVDFNPDGGGTQSSDGNIADVFLSKFDSSGNWQWTKTWGDSGGDYGNSVSLDQSGNAYVTGYFWGNVDFNPDGGGNQSSNGLHDVFLSKFDSAGFWQWTKTWGGTGGGDIGYSVSLDQSDNAYVTGSFTDTVEFNPDGGGTQSCNGTRDVFLSKFDSSGMWQWSKTWGGIDWDYGSSVSLDQSGNAYVTGNFQNTVDFNPDGGGTQSSNGDEDVFLSKFDSSGNWQWSQTWGGIDVDYGRSVSLDQPGNAYVSGHFQNTVDFNPDGGGTQSSNGNEDVFLSKFDSSGNWQWSQTWGGTNDDSGLSVSLDQSGNAYVTGHFFGIVDFNPDGGDPQTAIDWYDAFLWKGNYQ